MLFGVIVNVQSTKTMESKMKKVVALAALAALVTGCSSTLSNKFEARAEFEKERRQAAIERSINEAPDWFTEIPANSDAVVYGTGTATSGDYNMAIGVARTNAFESICMAAGGAVKSQTKVYRSDTASKSSALNTTAIKSLCPSVDITGAEVENKKIVAEDGRYRAYVRVALPMGDANVMKRTKVNDQLERMAVVGRAREFKELDRETLKEAR